MEDKRKLSKFKILSLIFGGIIILIIVVMLIVMMIYNNNLKRVSDSDTLKEVEILKGLSSKGIATILKDFNLIKDENAFLVYLKLNNVNDLKFGTYLFSENMGVKEIVRLLREGSKYNPDEVKITIQEGLNMREIAKIIASKTSNSYDDVINKSNDVNYINALIEKYWFITDEVLNDNLYYKLEGYLFPDTYILANKDVDVEYIFNKMIDELSKKLSEYENYDYSTLSIHQRLTLASMVEKEGGIGTDRVRMASAFLNRLNRGHILGSDVTARYAHKIDDKNKRLSASEFQFKSPYNTRLQDGSMNGKLPVGPISSLSKVSIDAAFNPADTDDYYFISNIQTLETFFYTYDNYNGFLAKKAELEPVNKGY